MKAALSMLVASIVGGFYMWIVLAQATEIPILFFIFLAIFCYVIVRWITKKSKANTAVLIATLLSFIISFLIGDGLASMFGKPW